MKDYKDSGYRILLEEIALGNQRAFTKLYDLFWSDLLFHVLKKVQDRQVAEDILHDVFVSLWNRRADIAGIESIPAYLYSACRYKIISYYRKKIPISVDVALFEEQIEDGAESIEDRLYFRYLLDLVENEIEDLPEQCRLVFKLSRFSFLSNKEIAKKLSISESTVENHIYKAVKRLRSASNKHLFIIFF